MQQILGNETLWRYRGKLDCQNALLGVQHIKNVAELCNLKKGTTEEQCLRYLYDTLGMMYAIWWREGMNISRRKIGSNADEIQVLVSFHKDGGKIGTVIDEKII